MSPQRFSLASRLLHWIMAPLLVAMLLVGTGMVASVSPWRTALLGLHKPLGVILLALAVLRLLLRLAGKTPPLPDSIPAPLRLAAHLSHWLLYGCMLAMPLIGWAMLSAGGFPLPWHLPPLPAPGVERYALLRGLHTLLGELFYLLVIGHVLAGLLHGVLLRDGVFGAIGLWRGKGGPGLRPKNRRPPKTVIPAKAGIHAEHATPLPPHTGRANPDLRSESTRPSTPGPIS